MATTTTFDFPRVSGAFVNRVPYEILNLQLSTVQFHGTCHNLNQSTEYLGINVTRVQSAAFAFRNE